MTMSPGVKRPLEVDTSNTNSTSTLRPKQQPQTPDKTIKVMTVSEKEASPLKRRSPQASSQHNSKRVCRLSPSQNMLSEERHYISPLKIAVVCSSNQNRSMEAHQLLHKRGYNVASFGTGSSVKLPGASLDKPNVYSFSVSYEEQYRDLKAKDQAFYTQNGLLNMLDRNRRIKLCPERFQESKEEFDIIITCQERVFDQVLEDLTQRGGDMCKMTHVINVEIKDNHDDATLGAFIIHDLIREICNAEDYESQVEDIISKLESKKKQRFLYSPAFY